MKRQILTAAFISWLTGSCVTAATVDHDAALHYATEFLSERGLSASLRPVSLSAISRSVSLQQSDAVHIFNIGENEGYVIIAGDDRAKKILAYSDTGYIDMATMPEACRAWVEQYAEEISSLPADSHAANTAGQTYDNKQANAVAPLLKSRWDQKSPYNLQCPVDITTGRQSVTGCVATATAQIMYYHRHPLQATGTVSYEDRNQKIVRELDFSAIAPFDWNHMTDTYDGSADDESSQAVASLMKAVGYGTKMQYSSDTSIAYHWDAGKALIDYFGYDRNIHFYERGSMSDSEWTDLIISELEAGRPVLYDGRNPSMGHTFICDGYDGNGYFHFNWGWSGMSDGYYSLSALNPSEQSTGGSAGGYTLKQAVLCHIAPQGTPGSVAQTERLLNIDKLYFRDATSFHIASETPELHTTLDDSQLFFYSFNKGLNDFTGEVCAAVINDSGITPISTTTVSGLENNNYTAVRFPLADVSLADGKYRIGFYYRCGEQDGWHVVKCSTANAPSECYATVSGRNLTLSPVMPTISIGLASELNWNHLHADAPATWTFDIANAGDIRLEGYAGIALTDASGDYKGIYVSPILCPANKTVTAKVNSTLKEIAGGTYQAIPFYTYSSQPTKADITPLSQPVEVKIAHLSIFPENGSYLMTDNADSPLRLSVTNLSSDSWEGKLEADIIAPDGSLRQGNFSADVAVAPKSTATAMLTGDNLNLERGNYILNLYMSPGRDLLLTSISLLVTSHVSGLDEIGTDAMDVKVADSHIYITSPSQLSAVTLHDITGHQLIGQNANGNETAIDISGLQRGVFILTIVRSDGSHDVRKINIRNS